MARFSCALLLGSSLLGVSHQEGTTSLDSWGLLSHGGGKCQNAEGGVHCICSLGSRHIRLKQLAVQLQSLAQMVSHVCRGTCPLCPLVNHHSVVESSLSASVDPPVAGVFAHALPITWAPENKKNNNMSSSKISFKSSSNSKINSRSQSVFKEPRQPSAVWVPPLRQVMPLQNQLSMVPTACQSSGWMNTWLHLKAPHFIKYF